MSASYDLAMADEVQSFIDSIEPERRRRDAAVLLRLMQEATGEEPTVHGSMIGFGSYRYRYASGRQGTAPAAAFAPRKSATTVYLMDGVGAYPDLLGRLGPHTTGVGCLYLKDVSQIDLGVLRQIVSSSYATLTAGTFTDRAREGSPKD